MAEKEENQTLAPEKKKVKFDLTIDKFYICLIGFNHEKDIKFSFITYFN
jgi:hypothetical protein